MSYLKASLRIELYADDTLVASIVDEDMWEDCLVDILALHRAAGKAAEAAFEEGEGREPGGVPDE